MTRTSDFLRAVTTTTTRDEFSEQVARKSLLRAKSSKNFLQNRWKTSYKIAELDSKWLKKLLKNCPKTCSKLQKNYSKIAENLLQKRGRNRKDSHSIYRRANNYARFQLLYGHSTAILMDTAPFRVNDAAVVRPYYGSLTVAVLR